MIRSLRRAIPNYSASLVRDGLKGTRIGVLRQAYERPTTDAEIVNVFTKALADLIGAGAEIVDPATVDLEQVQRDQNAGACMGFKYDINAYLAAQGDRVPVHSLEEIIKSRRFHPSVQVRLEAAQASSPQGPDSAACREEMRYRAAFGAAVTKTMDALTLDAFVYPTWSNPPRLIGDLNTPGGDNNQLFAPSTGFPAITVPMGYTNGDTLPAGLQFFGRAWSEPLLLKLAYAYEQATHHRKPPSLTPPLR